MAVGLALLVPAGGSSVLVLVEVAASLAAGAVAAVVVERWMSARAIDLRHHDLAAPARTEVQTPVSVTAPLSAPHALATEVQHQLFGLCECAHCKDGLPSAGDLEATAPRAGLSGRTTLARQVVDLRTGVSRPRRAHLGRRSASAG